MVTGGDCSCVDTTEPSNLTSLRSDDATSVINSDVNAICTETIDRNDAVEEPKGIFIHFFQTFYKSKLYIYIYKASQNHTEYSFDSRIFSRTVNFFFQKCQYIEGSLWLYLVPVSITFCARFISFAIAQSFIFTSCTQKQTANVPIHH